MGDTVVYAGREFTLEAPTTDHIVGILNVVGSMAVRAEGIAARLVQNPTSRAVLFGFLAAMSKDDLERLGAIVLQFPTDSQGRKEARAFFDEKGILVAPIVQALLANFRLSSDLVEALQAFFVGIDEIAGSINTMLPDIQVPKEESKSED